MQTLLLDACALIAYLGGEDGLLVVILVSFAITSTLFNIRMREIVTDIQ